MAEQITSPESQQKKIGVVEIMKNYYAHPNKKVLFKKPITWVVPEYGTFCEHLEHQLDGTPRCRVISEIVGENRNGNNIFLNYFIFKLKPEDLGKKIIADCKIVEVDKNGYKSIHIKLTKRHGRPEELWHMKISGDKTGMHKGAINLPQCKHAKINLMLIY